MKYLLLSLTVLVSLSLQAQDLSVISYNIRYNSSNDGADLWDLRKEELVGQLKQHAPSTFGLQEAMLVQMQYLDTELESYDYVGVGREDGDTAGEFSAIFYQKDRFEVRQSGTFWLSETPEKVSTGWDAALPRICTYAKFYDRELHQSFWHFNTHFDHMGEVARDESARLILTKIEELTNPEDRVVVTGDFNAMPEDAPILRMKKAMDDPLETLKLQGPLGTFSGFKLDAPLDRRIDYIFSQNLKPSSYQHLNERRANGRFISDHMAVKAEFNL